jgi:hypothetical protein
MSRGIFEEPQAAQGQPIPETDPYKTVEIINSSTMAVQ